MAISVYGQKSGYHSKVIIQRSYSVLTSWVLTKYGTGFCYLDALLEGFTIMQC